MSAIGSLRLVVGLGNPGEKYRHTRHNIGFLTIDEFAAQQNLKWEKNRKFQAEITRSENLHLLKPLTYMNHSGEAVRSYASYFQIAPEEMLIILDDLAFAPGVLRIRKSGSGGGHNGLISVIQNLGSKDVPRLRVGIGKAQFDTSRYVLSEIPAEEWTAHSKGIAKAVKSIFAICDKGLDTAMNLYNTSTTEIF